MSHSSDKSLLFDEARVERILQRIAYQIVERHLNNKIVVIIGIVKKGELIAGKLHRYIDSIGERIEIKSGAIDLGLDLKQAPKIIGLENSDLENAHIMLVDDVLNTGKTLIYACKHLLDYNPASLGTAVIVNREHCNYPIHIDFVGLSLSTNLSDFIEVEIKKDKYQIYLR